MNSLRRQLLLSHLLLIGLMLLLLAGGVARFFHLGRSIDRVLDANVKSVLLMQRTKDALGELERAGGKDEVAARAARGAITDELGNLTEPGERELAEGLQKDFSAYRAGKTGRKEVAEKAQAILELNLAAMRGADARAKSEARQSALLGLGATALAAVVALGLALRTVRSALLPLVSLARQAEEIGAGRLNQRIAVPQGDEIGTLAGAFNEMSEKLAGAREALQTRLIRAERLGDVALENLYDPVLVTDAEGKLLHVNAAAEEILGKKVGQPVGEARLAAAIDRALRERRAVAGEDDDSLVTLGERTFRVRVSPLQTESQPLGTVAVLEDVMALREVDRLKTEFIGVASHELRTPVTSLLLSVQLLAEGAVGELTDAQHEVVAAQREDLLRLERLLLDLLDLTKLESGATPLRLEAVAVRGLIETAVEGVRAEAESKGVALVLGPIVEETLSADREQIGRVLTNLLGNAVRHTPTGGSVTVSAEIRGEKVAVTVRDNGAGIPRAYLDSIFERFTQVPGATRGGAGLGLSLARSLVTAHGGEIWAESDGEGNGSAFTFALNAISPGFPPTPSTPPAPESATPSASEGVGASGDGGCRGKAERKDQWRRF